jgi:hypothetical protein
LLKKGTATVAFREFGSECGIVAVNLILRLLEESWFPARYGLLSPSKWQMLKKIDSVAEREGFEPSIELLTL